MHVGVGIAHCLYGPTDTQKALALRMSAVSQRITVLIKNDCTPPHPEGTSWGASHSAGCSYFRREHDTRFFERLTFAEFAARSFHQSSATSLPPDKPRCRCARLHALLLCIGGISSSCDACCSPLNTQRRESCDRKEYTRECKDDYDRLRTVVSLLLLKVLCYYCQAVSFRPDDAFVRLSPGCVICVDALQDLPLG